MISPILFNVYSEYMMKETVENNARYVYQREKILTTWDYAEDAAFITDEESKLEGILGKLQEICSQYKICIRYVKKTNDMVSSKNGGEKCNVVINRVLLEQVADYKYLGSWITEDGRCEKKVKTRIAMAKATQRTDAW